jgi:hypothetical protein
VAKPERKVQQKNCDTFGDSLPLLNECEKFVEVANVMSVSIRKVVFIFLVAASFVFSGKVFAHNISQRTAKSKVNQYAAGVVEEKRKVYKRFNTSCADAFSGHNHYVRCTVKYYSDSSSDSPVACKEKLEVFFQPHNFFHGESYKYYMRHTTESCGRHTFADQPRS